MMKSNERVGYIQLGFFSVLAGAVGVFVKLVDGLSVNSIVFFRAAVGLLTVFLAIGLIKGFKEIYLVKPFRTILVGVFQGISILLYFMAVIQTSVSNAVFLLYTAPIFSIIFAKYFLKEKIYRETILGMIVAVAGIVLILDPTSFTFSSGESMGNLMALGSGFFYAAMALVAKPILEKKSGYYMAFWQFLVISLMFVPFLFTSSASDVLANWWQLLVIGVFCTGIAFILFMEGAAKVKAQKIFIVTSLEPLAGTLLALLVISEMPSVWTVIGGLLILAGVYVATRRVKEVAI